MQDNFLLMEDEAEPIYVSLPIALLPVLNRSIALLPSPLTAAHGGND